MIEVFKSYPKEKTFLNIQKKNKLILQVMNDI